MTVPFATAYNEDQKAPGLPTERRMHRNHANVYGEHKHAFANHVGVERRSTMAPSDALHFSQEGGFARKQRDLDALRERTRAQQARHRDPRESNRNRVANKLSTSNLNTKSMFQHFDRNQDGTINFRSFSNGLRLAGVQASETVQRDLFDAAAQNGRLNYKSFVDDMKVRARKSDTKTSLDIADPHMDLQDWREQTSRSKLYDMGVAIPGSTSETKTISSSSSSSSSSSAFPSSTATTTTTSTQQLANKFMPSSHRVTWNDMSTTEKQDNLVRDRVMRKLQEKHDQVEAAFVSVDQQRDGCLNKTEFAQGLKRVGLTLSDTDSTSLFNSLPRGADGLLNYHEFSRYLQVSHVGSHSAGQVRATNYTKEHGMNHIVQQRVADVVSLKKKDLEIVFREKDQGRGGRDAVGRCDGMVSLHDVDDVLKSVGIILSAPDTERLFDRVDSTGQGLVPYREFLRATCGEFDDEKCFFIFFIIIFIHNNVLLV